MPLELPPRGTFGTETPSVVRTLIKATSFMSNLMFKMGGSVKGRPLLRLTTKGARSGRRRRVVLGAFPEGERNESWLIVASNGGSASHPGWAFNLAHDPARARVEFAGERFAVQARLVSGPERETVWKHVTDVSPGYKVYETKTDREIPIFRLTATEREAGA